MSTSSSPPVISHILETCLYVRDVEKSANFYKSTLDMEPFLITVQTPTLLHNQVDRN